MPSAAASRWATGRVPYVSLFLLIVIMFIVLNPPSPTGYYKNSRYPLLRSSHTRPDLTVNATPTSSKPITPSYDEEDVQDYEILTAESQQEATLSATAPTPLSSDKPCYGFPDTSDILIVMKTGATEAYEKLPIHFMSTLKCTNDSLLVSDMDMDMAGHHLVDVLENFPQELQENNQDFDLYRRLKEYRELHQDALTLRYSIEGWNLDKYKFIPMLEKTWEHRQNASWYFFVEADTGVNWTNLRTYLDMLDPTQPHYIGSPAWLDIEFAHGGTGYVISHAAMKAVFGGENREIGELYNKEVQSICCGDRMVAKVLLDHGIRMTSAWPLFNGEKPLSLAFGHDQWCHPVITMHHLTPEEVSQVWNFNQRHRRDGVTAPTTWKDIFNHFVRPSLSSSSERHDWDNLSSDITFSTDPTSSPDGSRRWEELSPTEKTAGQTPQHCKALCDEVAECVQWLHQENECKLSMTIKLGFAKSIIGDVKYTSGWNNARIKGLLDDMGDCLDGEKWGDGGQWRAD